MAKKKRRNTESMAPQRSDQVRVQSRRNERSAIENSKLTPGQVARRKARKRTSSTKPWLWVGGIVVAIAVIIGIFVLISNQQSNAGVIGPTDPAVLQQVTGVKQSALADVGTGGVQNPMQPVAGNQPILNGPSGKPQLLYYGAEWCPYCAADRWSVVVALSRFGTFKQLPETTSSGSDVYPNTATFSFHQSQYSSNYIDFVPLEVQDRDGKTVLTPTPEQQQLLNHYKITGFPFMNIAERYTATSLYSPDVLSGLSQKKIADQLSDPTSKVSQNILGAANYLTAAICAATQNQPANVCTVAPIPSVSQTLMTSPASPQSSIGNSSFAMIAPRREGLS
ncbi:DUF929 domain-containing protein [Ktedonosporobacter rubrisoli]|uniref:DUF929 domain-containing protein n=1 Tax=Ktedonosporobacter rubrisoli TaxID=2509675 RepID=A0A4P6K0X9_KTERU|nr:DUF929 family protein [Ktedonosporobacter rubrisoli]QBD81714.1 DUF929 domain-containing protein [Ktedonosporobacter rubrisoli]